MEVEADTSEMEVEADTDDEYYEAVEGVHAAARKPAVELTSGRHADAKEDGKEDGKDGASSAAGESVSGSSLKIPVLPHSEELQVRREAERAKREARERAIAAASAARRHPNYPTEQAAGAQPRSSEARQAEAHEVEAAQENLRPEDALDELERLLLVLDDKCSLAQQHDSEKVRASMRHPVSQAEQLRAVVMGDAAWFESASAPTAEGMHDHQAVLAKLAEGTAFMLRGSAAKELWGIGGGLEERMSKCTGGEANGLIRLLESKRASQTQSCKVKDDVFGGTFTLDEWLKTPRERRPTTDKYSSGEQLPKLLHVRADQPNFPVSGTARAHRTRTWTRIAHARHHVPPRPRARPNSRLMPDGHGHGLSRSIAPPRRPSNACSRCRRGLRRPTGSGSAPPAVTRAGPSYPTSGRPSSSSCTPGSTRKATWTTMAPTPSSRCSPASC